MPKFVMDRRIVTILGIVFAQLLGASMILPVLSLYAINQLGMPEEQTPLIQASFFIAQFIAAPLMGRLSDRIGRIPVLLWCQVGTVLSFLMIAVAPSIGMIFASRVLDGVTGGNLIVAQAYVVDITPKERRTQALGLIFAMFGLGFVIGPSLGGAIAAAFGREATFYAAAFVTTIPLIMTRLWLREPMTADERRALRTSSGQTSIGMMLRNPTLLIIFGVVVFGSLGLGVVQTTFAIYGQNILFAGEPEQTVSLGVGVMLGVIGLGQTITQLVILKRLLARYGDARLVVIGAFVRAVSMLWLFMVGLPLILATFGQSALPVLAIPGALLFAVGTGLMMPPLQSLATYLVTDSARGTVVGLASSAQSLGVIMGTLISSPLLTLAVSERPSIAQFLFNTVMFAVLVIPGLALVRRFRGQYTVLQPAAD